MATLTEDDVLEQLDAQDNLFSVSYTHLRAHET